MSLDILKDWMSDNSERANCQHLVGLPFMFRNLSVCVASPLGKNWPDKMSYVPAVSGEKRGRPGCQSEGGTLETGTRTEAKPIKDSRKHCFLRLIFLRSSTLPVAQTYAQALSLHLRNASYRSDCRESHCSIQLLTRRLLEWIPDGNLNNLIKNIAMHLKFWRL